MNEPNNQNQEGSFQRQMQADISQIKPADWNVDKINGKAFQISVYDEMKNLSILDKSQQLRKDNPELAEQIDAINQLKKIIKERFGQQNQKEVINKILHFGYSKEENEEVQIIQYETQKAKNKVIQLNNDQQIRKIKIKQLQHALRSKAIVNETIQKNKKQSQAKIIKNESNINAEINLNYFTLEELKHNKNYQDSIKQHLQQLLQKQRMKQQKMKKQIVQISQRTQRLQEGTRLKRQSIINEKNEDETKLLEDLIQNEQKAIEGLKVCLSRIQRERAVQQKQKCHKKTFKRL